MSALRRPRLPSRPPPAAISSMPPAPAEIRDSGVMPVSSRRISVVSLLSDVVFCIEEETDGTGEPRRRTSRPPPG